MVRIWCLPISLLDRQHLLGEHVELHTIVTALLRGKGGFSNHPQTKRFKNHIGMLVDRHNQQVQEMLSRGYHHHSPLPNHLTPEKYLYSESERISDFKTLKERNGLREDH